MTNCASPCYTSRFTKLIYAIVVPKLPMNLLGSPTWPRAAPQSKNSIMCILDHMQSTFLCCGKFMKNLADDQCSSVTKGNIYYIKHMYIHPFSKEVDWPENWCLKEVSNNMFHIAHTAFLLCEAEGHYSSELGLTSGLAKLQTRLVLPLWMIHFIDSGYFYKAFY